jgi:threonine dehydratase
MNEPGYTAPGPGTIREAAARIAGKVHHTPVLTNTAINRMLGAEILFKCENFQKVGAFKARGATNAVFSLSPEELRKGVCTHSSGNHAQALSRAAALAGAKAFIVMPSNSSRIKVEAVREYGGEITFCEPTLEARESTLANVQDLTGAIEIHPYNDLRIIAGQATACMELIGEAGPFDIIMAPVGGGGLLSGTALSAHYFSPSTTVIAAEPEMADDAFRSFRQRNFVPSVNPQTIADGLRTSLGTLTFPIILRHVSDIVTCSEDSIIRAMRLIWERMKILVEPSSAVPLAALLEGKADVAGKRSGIILSGGNVDLDTLPWIKP